MPLCLSRPLSLRLNQQQKSELGSQVEELQKALQDLGSKTEDVSGNTPALETPDMNPPAKRLYYSN